VRGYESNRRSLRPDRLHLVGGGNRGRRGNAGALLAVVLCLGIVTGILHNHWRAQTRPDPVLAGVRLLTYPFQTGGAIVEAGLFTNWNGIFRARQIEADNARLTAENAVLRSDNELLRAGAAEALRLRAVVNLIRNSAKPPLAASVIALLPTPHFDTVTVNRGTRDGVQFQSVARTPQGLLGQVTDVSALSSEVMLLTDLNSGVGALVRRNGKLQGIGIVQGTGRGQPLELQNLKRDDDVRPGDLVVTSGYGGVFPADIPIGTITAVHSADARFLRTAVVAPAAPMPGDLREVLLLQP
jgi:rod shape-determining protein MreC